MLLFLSFFSVLIVIIISINLKRNTIHHKFRKTAVFYNLLFVSLFITVTLYYLGINNIQTAMASFKNSLFDVGDMQAEEATEVIKPVEKIFSEGEANEIIKIQTKVLLKAPIVSQYPELPRGCEVSSLAMLLQYAGVDVDKLTLAAAVKKDYTPYLKQNGKIYYGDPNDGFIGDMYSKSNRGYGVYHKPIADLADQFLPGQIIDITGSGFKQIEMYLSSDTPVWVITNTQFRKLPDRLFEHWETPNGIIKITYFEHSVLITGYDENYVYFNDPLTGTINKKAQKDEFISAWEQMGRQAITYLH